MARGDTTTTHDVGRHHVPLWMRVTSAELRRLRLIAEIYNADDATVNREAEQRR
jgi:hypothetical protein